MVRGASKWSRVEAEAWSETDSVPPNVSVRLNCARREKGPSALPLKRRSACASCAGKKRKLPNELPPKPRSGLVWRGQNARDWKGNGWTVPVADLWAESVLCRPWSGPACFANASSCACVLKAVR